MRTHIILTCCAALCCAGCGTYSRYSRPAVEVDGLYGASVQEADTLGGGIGALSWRTLFADSLLQQLIEEGLANNTDLRIAALRVSEAEASLVASRLAYLPSVGLAPQGALSKAEGSATAKTYSLALSAEWELDLAGRLTADKRRQAATTAAMRAAHQAVATQLVATIANSYYNLLTLDSKLTISRQTHGAWAETLRTLQAQKAVGEATEAAVAQARASLLSVEGSILTLNRLISEQESSLSVLLGVPPRPIARSAMSGQAFPDTVSAGLPLRLLAHRPDVRQAEHELQAAHYAEAAARAAFYPQITLSGSAGWTNSDGAAIANPGQWLFNAVASLAQPLFNRGKNRANLLIAQAQRDEALLSFQQSLLRAGQEVNDALTQWQTARQRLAIDATRVAALDQAVAATRLLLTNSSAATYLEVLTAQQALLDAQLAQADDRYAQVQAVVALYHALGGGAH